MYHEKVDLHFSSLRHVQYVWMNSETKSGYNFATVTMHTINSKSVALVIETVLVMQVDFNDLKVHSSLVATKFYLSYLQGSSPSSQWK
jgi:hypothetical protein